MANSRSILVWKYLEFCNIFPDESSENFPKHRTFLRKEKKDDHSPYTDTMETGSCAHTSEN